MKLTSKTKTRSRRAPAKWPGPPLKVKIAKLKPRTMAEAFDEWLRLYTEDPNRFNSSVAEVLTSAWFGDFGPPEPLSVAPSVTVAPVASLPVIVVGEPQAGPVRMSAAEASARVRKSFKRAS